LPLLFSFASVRPRIFFLLDWRAKKPLLALFSKTNSQFLLSLAVSIQKWQTTIVLCMLKYKCYWNVHKFLESYIHPVTVCGWQQFSLG
jgi:putative effector of murein hydrolase